MTPTTNHNPTCTNPHVRTVTGRRGDLLARCTGCGWFTVIDPAELHPPAPQEPRWSPARLVCREHHDQPVNARGKGCRKCARR